MDSWLLVLDKDKLQSNRHSQLKKDLREIIKIWEEEEQLGNCFKEAHQNKWILLRMNLVLVLIWTDLMQEEQTEAL